MIVEIVERAAEGKKDLIDHKPIDAAEQARLRLQRERRLLDAALQRAHQNLAAIVMNEAATILKKHLQPAFDRVVGAARKVAPDLRGVLDGAAALKAGGDVVEAWNALEKLTARYRMIRKAYRVLFDLVFKSETADTDARFAEIENLGAIWPGAHKRNLEDAPWPKDSHVGRLAYLGFEWRGVVAPHTRGAGPRPCGRARTRQCIARRTQS